MSIKILFRIVICVLSVVGLIAIKALEKELFYDPILIFFKKANPLLSIPNYDGIQLTKHHIIRFFLNFIFSIGLIYGLFGQKKYLNIGIIIMIMSFLISYPLYYFMLETKLEYGYQLTFYLRRFVIQPMPLLLLIPMFYYLKNIDSTR